MIMRRIRSGMGTWKRVSMRGLFCLPALIALPACAQPSLNRSLDISVEADTIAVSGDDVGVSVGYIAYTDTTRSPRPVLFAFNGGPGASSTFLHLGVLGPSRLELPADPAAPLPKMAPRVANANSLADVVDIVFLDPPGTGFSTREGSDPALYNTVAGDAGAVAQAISIWLKKHARSDAPVYILGESYGTIRAVAMLDAFAARDEAPDIRGIILLGQALNMIETSQRPDNILSYVVSLPSLAAIACYHGKAGPLCTPPEIAKEAAQFAEKEYLHALFVGQEISAEEKRRIAKRLEELSGITAEYYIAHDLRISKEEFRVELLREESKVVGRYDARYVSPLSDDAGSVVGPDAFSAVSQLYAEAMPAYLAEVLSLPNSENYKVIALPEGGWRYGSEDSPFADWPFMASVERAARINPCLRLLIGTGLFDLTTTIGAADYLFAQSSLPSTRRQSEIYGAGHMFYSDSQAREKFLLDMRNFISEDSCT